MVVTILLFIFIVAPLSLFLHELGHVLPGLLLRSDRSVIHVGRGKVLITGKLKKLQVDLHLLFFHGAYSMNERHDEFSIREKAYISAGGPFLNGVMALIYFVWPPFLMYDVVTLFLLFNFYLAIVNLIPFVFRGNASDGYHLLKYAKLIVKRVE